MFNPPIVTLSTGYFISARDMMHLKLHANISKYDKVHMNRCYNIYKLEISYDSYLPLSRDT